MSGFHWYNDPRDGRTLFGIHTLTLMCLMSITWIILCGGIVGCDGADFGANCASDNDCTYTGAACTNTVCGCDSTGYYINNQNGGCDAEKMHNDACSDTVPCREDLGLSCVDAVCACSDPATEFWDASVANPECKPVKNFGESCPSNQDTECKNNAKCLNTDCGCDAGNFWNTNGEKCELIKNFGESCPSNQDTECKNNAKCLNTDCGCDAGNFWNTNGEKCELIKNFGESCPSNQDTECKNNAKCLDAVCDCDAGNFWNTNGEKCEPIKNVGYSCPSNQNEECKNNAKCLKTVCGCDAGNFWNQDKELCDLTGGFESICSSGQDDECTPGLGLVCSDTKTCVCTDADFWDNGVMACQPTKDYRVGCPSTEIEECKYNLRCLMLDGSNRKCDCNPSDYWKVDNQNCEAKKPYEEPCDIFSGYSEIESCADELTECTVNTSTSIKCLCKPGYFRNTGQSQCQDMSLLKVTNVQISEYRETELDVTWSVPTLDQYVNKYKVDWSTSNDASSVDVEKADMKSITGLTPGKTYTVSVKTVETKSRPGDQTVSSDDISQQTRPGQPGTLLTDQDALDAPAFSLSWTPSPGEVDQYIIELAERNRDGNPVNDANALTFGSSMASVNVAGLKHGQRYMVTVTAKTGNLLSSPYQEIMRTNPTKPGAPQNVMCADILDINIMLKWDAPDSPNGDITSYQVITKTYPSPSLVSTDDTDSYQPTSYKVGSLDPATYYIFTVATENDAPTGMSFSSATRVASHFCRTKDPASEMPQMLSTTGVTSRQASVSWKLPANTYGPIHSYTVLVKDMAACIQHIIVKCDGCNSPNADWKRLCQDNPDLTPIKKTVGEGDLRNLSYTVQYQVMGLDPYKQYTVLVFSSNMAGKGHDAEVTIDTKQEVPQTPRSIVASQITEMTLELTWNIDGPRPGVTTYNVTTYEVLDGTIKSVDVVVIEGFENRSISVTGLEEFMTYKFTVKAVTDVGSSSAGNSDNYTTLPAPPLKVRSFSIAKVTANNYTAAVATWMDPLPRDKNGILEKYILAYKINNEENSYETYDRLPVEGDSYSVTVYVIPETEYSFKVWGINQNNLIGEFVERPYKAPAGPPPDLDVNILTIPVKAQTTFQSFKVDVNEEFFNDRTNGELTQSGLLVCKENKCDDDKDSGMDRTWKQAKQVGFPPYRVTNDTWKENIQTDETVRSRRSVTTKYYIIGEDSNCEKRSEDVHCNGPLPDSSNFKVKAFVCTRGGCTVLRWYGPFVTRTPEEEGNMAAIIGGAVGAAVLLVVVVLLVLFLVLFFIRTQKKGNLCCYKEDLYERPQNAKGSEYSALDFSNRGGQDSNRKNVPDSGVYENERLKTAENCRNNSTVYQNRGFEGNNETVDAAFVDCQYEEIGTPAIAVARQVPAEGISFGSKDSNTEVGKMEKYRDQLRLKKNKLMKGKKKDIEKKKANIQLEIRQLEKELQTLETF